MGRTPDTAPPDLLEPQPHGGALRRLKAAPAADLLDNGLWLSVSALAKRKGTTKQTVSERVRRLVDAGLLETRPGANRAKLVNLAQYDRAVGQVGDPAKEAAAATKAEDAAPETATDPRYRDAKALDAHYAAELKRLEFEERTGKLVPLADVEAAQETAARAIVNVLDRLPLRAAEVAAAVGQEGEVGARRVLRAAVFDQRTAVAEALAALKTGEAEPPAVAAE
jgi:DNA-binding MarR family transcriptional regulator